MSLEAFYQRKGYGNAYDELPPVWMADGASLRGGKLSIADDKFLDWFETTITILENFCRPVWEDAWANRLWFTAEYLPTLPLVIRTTTGSYVKIPRQLAPLVINQIGRLTEHRVSNLSVYKASFDTQPVNEYSEADRMTGRLLKISTERTKSLNELDNLLNSLEKSNMIHGHTFARVDWMKNLGDRKGKNSEDREGATQISEVLAWHLIPWRPKVGKTRWLDVPCAFEIFEVLHVDEARKKYGNKDIQPTNRRSIYTFESPFIEELSPDEVVIYRFVYRPDEYLPFGFVVKFTDDVILEKEAERYPWSHERLPWIRYTDIDVPGRFFPMSFYQNLKPMQHTYNTLSGLLKKYIYTLGHPKIVHQRGTVNPKSLGNTASLISVKPSATMTPSILQVKSIGPDPFNFRNDLGQQMDKFANIHGIDTGQLPPNTRSGIMISRLREIEEQSRAPSIDKRNEFIRAILLMTASVDAERLPTTSKGNQERIFGKELLPDVKELAEVKVFAQHKITIQNSSGFSRELTGRISEISALEKEAGLVLSPQEKRDILGGILRERPYDVITAAKFAAQDENEKMNNGQVVPSPEITEDLVTHWFNHFLDFQTHQHKRLPPKIKKIKELHMLETEMLIEEVLDKNPSSIFAERVKALEGYPRLYTLSVDPEVPSAPQQPQMPPMMALPPGGAPPPGPVA